MTEQDWLASTNSQVMLDFVCGGNPLLAECPSPSPSARRLRLFVAACCRQVWHLLTDERSRRAVEVAERFADGEATEEELLKANRDGRSRPDGGLFLPNTAVGVLVWTASHISLVQCLNEWLRADNTILRLSTQAALLRDITGNPFRPVTLPKGRRKCAACEGKGTVPNYTGMYRLGSNPCYDCEGRGHTDDGPCPWLTPTVVALARAAYQERPGRVCVRCRGSGLSGTGYGQFGGGRCPDCHGTGHIEGGHLDNDRLTVLADALEEAGCEDEAILNHLRSMEPCPGCSFGETPYYSGGGGWCAFCDRSGPDIHYLQNLDAVHVRGCWAIDCVLGRE